MSTCVEQMLKIEKEYVDAVLRDDENLMEQKKLEMQAYQSSLTLTAYMFDEVDEISTWLRFIFIVFLIQWTILLVPTHLWKLYIETH